MENHVGRVDWKLSGANLRLDPAVGALLSERIYRYASIAEALMLCSGKMTFASPALWPDKYESHVIDKLFATPGPFARAVPLVKCFSLEYSSEAMWRTYSGAGGLIRLSIRLSDLVDELNKMAWPVRGKIYAGRVRYMKPVSLRTEVARLSGDKHLKRTMNHAMPALLAKRAGFAFENEIRFAFLPNRTQGEMRFVTVKGFPSQKLQRILIDPYLPKWQADELVRLFRGRVSAQCKVEQSSFDARPTELLA